MVPTTKKYQHAPLSLNIIDPENKYEPPSTPTGKSNTTPTPIVHKHQNGILKHNTEKINKIEKQVSFSNKKSIRIFTGKR